MQSLPPRCVHKSMPRHVHLTYLLLAASSVREYTYFTFFQFQSLVLHESFEMSSRASLGDLCNSSGCIVNISKQLAVETQGRIYMCGGPG